ncbi:ABC transporter ATP-binding protein [uncultured Alsobacter sp.]|uniref:ABC transporter ATP-binding protein n=1 Tax=uncultured Alsobacter sp. TaxID=1748258 RepID=UPI0025E29244|nr:oligopeptide/dipeptide ABC transporter ATP-binding protein [uncultured Alsobacter sp.]
MTALIDEAGPAVSVRGLRRDFVRGGGLLSTHATVRAVDGVSFDVSHGEVLGIVGESGSGKSTLARLITGLLRPTAGDVRIAGRSLAEADRRQRARLIQQVFQDPYSSLNPTQRVRDIVALPLVAQGDVPREERARRVSEMLALVGLDPAVGERYPGQMSGGQRQRVAIARALVLKPRIVVCDEPTSALDVSVQAQILNLLQALRRELNLTLVFISHNLAVVEHIATHVAVMYLGRIVEAAPTAELFGSPRHPYTAALLQSVLTPEPGKGIPRIPLGEGFPDPAAIPPGCRFHPRCPSALPACADASPPLRVDAGHLVECILAPETASREATSQVHAGLGP